MAYSRWATPNELKEKLTKINYETDVKKSGIPMMYDNKNLYIRDDETHSMIIGSTGSGKTQSTMLPLVRLALKAQESLIINDVKGEIYNIISGELKKQKYNTYVIDLDNPTKGNCFNPLALPYQLYKNNQKDEAIELLEKIGYYFCCEEKVNTSIDSFWTDSATSLFVGLALYLFDNAKEEEINISSILNIVPEFDKISEQVKKAGRNSLTYINLSNIILAPNETKNSILSVFIQNLRVFASRESLINMLSSTDFEIKNVQKEKTAIFLCSKNKQTSRRLIPLVIEECYYAATTTGDKTRRLNVIIDEFSYLVPFKDFNDILTLSRSFNIKFSIYVRSLLELRNTYGTEATEILKLEFGNIIYLLANDIETLESISKLCGNKQTGKGLEPLISVEELKLLNTFEAVILIPRINPIKTKLLPDYKIDWKFSEEKVELKEIKRKEVKVFKI